MSFIAKHWVFPVWVWLLFMALAWFNLSWAGDRFERREPRLLTDIPMPPPRANPDSNIVPQPESAANGESGGKRDKSAPARRWNKPAVAAPKETPAAAESAPAALTDKYAALEQPPADNGAPEAPAPSPAETPAAPPTPEEVETYRTTLEQRLLERYNNLPDHAGKVAWVSVVLSKPLDVSLDGKFIKAEFDQLVYDSWGKRLPALEQEYFVVTFGSGGAEQVRADPSVRVGLDLVGSYSEMAPPIAPPLAKIPADEAFTTGRRDEACVENRPAMPAWWRPELPDLD